MIHHAMQSAKTDEVEVDADADAAGPSTHNGDPTPSTAGEHIDVEHDAATNTFHLKNVDPTSAGDNHAFLRSKLTWSTGEDGKERVLDEDGNGVMMGWEEPLMVAHVQAVKDRLKDKMDRGEEISVLNIGFGLGIVSLANGPAGIIRQSRAERPAPDPQIDTLLQDELHPTRHTIIEAHPSVLSHIRSTPFHEKTGVEILPGRWQDWCKGDQLAELIGKSAGGAGYDFVFIDTFAEDYEGQSGVAMDGRLVIARGSILCVITPLLCEPPFDVRRVA